MALPTACVLAQRRLWLQLMRRHYIAVAIEAFFAVSLCYLMVSRSTPQGPAIQLPKADYPMEESYPYTSARLSGVVYGPQNSVTQQLVEKAFSYAGWNPNAFTPVTDGAAVFPTCQQRKDHPVCIRFAEDFGRTAGANLNYELIINSGKTEVPETLPLEYPRKFRLSSTLDPSIMAAPVNYQAKIEGAYLQMEKNKTSPQSPNYTVHLRRIPEKPPAEADDSGYRLSSKYIYIMALCIPFVRRIAAISHEISSGMKDQQRTNGLSLVNFWTGHFLVGFLIEMTYCTITSGFMIFLTSPTGQPFFKHADITLLLAVMALFTTQHNLWAMLIAGVLPKGRYAVTLGAFLGFLVPYFDQTISDALIENVESLVLLPRFTKIRMALYPQVAADMIIRTLCIFDDIEGSAGWGSIFKHVLRADSLAIIHIIAIMIGGCLLVVFLLFYLTSVLPWATSLPESPLFCITPGYWCPSVTLRVRQGDEAPRDPRRFEEPPDGQPVIETTSLVKKFGNFTALNGVDMKIYGSSVTVLLGHNGAGKTTLMTILTGIQSPTSGSIKIDIEQDGTCFRRISFCPQFDVLFEDLTVAEHLFYFGKLQRAPSAKLNETVAETLKVVNMTDKWSCFPSQLSGGMKRRLSLSIALVAKPKILILDEPTTGLDPETRRSIWELVSKLRETTTILLSTHDMEEAEVLANRIVFLNLGKVVCEGSPTFLKKACGVGYTINFNTEPSKFDAKGTLDIVRKALPNAVMKDQKQGSATIALHTTEHKGLACLFEKLEDEGENLGIKSFGVSVATMADAYLIINKDWAPEAAAADDHDRSESAEAASLEPAAAACTGLETRPATGQRMRALLVKRLLYFSRSPMVILVGWIVPTLLFTLFSYGLKGLWETSSSSVQHTGRVELQSRIQFPNARCFIQGAPGTNFSRDFVALTKMEGLTVVDMKDAKSELIASAEADFLTYSTMYPFGVVVNATGIEGWYNPASPVSRSVILNLINTVLLRTYSGSPDARVNSRIKFFGGGTSQNQVVTKDIRKATSGYVDAYLFWPFVPPALLGLTVSTLVTFPIAEKLSGARELQLMTGVPGTLLIAAHLVFDFLVQYLVPFGVCFTVYSFWYRDDLPFITIVAIYAVMVFFAPVAIMEAYLLSDFVESEGSAYSIVLLVFVIGGGASFLVHILLQVHVNKRLLRALLMLIPSFALPQSISNVVLLNMFAEICLQQFPKGQNVTEKSCSSQAEITLRECCIERARNPNADLSPPGPFSLSLNSALPDLAYLAAQVVFLFTVLNLRYEERLRCPSVSWGTWQDQNLDADVEAEKELARKYNSTDKAATMEDEGYAVVACDLQKSFGSFRAVRGISLVLRCGECFGLLGVNGAGKSTTFQMLTGLLSATAGDAFMKDACLSANRKKWQSFIGYCPQVSGLLDRLNAYECLWMYARLRGVPEAKIKDAVESAIALTDLEKHAKKNCGVYSGGNKRKLTMAVAILGNPRVVFFDEPYAGVDVVARTKIQKNMDRIRRDTKIPMVLTSHHMEECEAACDRLCIMVAGQMTCVGTLQHLKDKFGKGYTMQLVLPPPGASSESGEGGAAAGNWSKELEAVVEKLFPGITVLSAKDNVLDFHIKDTMPWSNIFSNIDELDKKFHFSHVLVQDTNLEQLFIAFAQKKDAAQRS